MVLGEPEQQRARLLADTILGRRDRAGFDHVGHRELGEVGQGHARDVPGAALGAPRADRSAEAGREQLRVGGATYGARGERRVEPRERQELQQERLGDRVGDRGLGVEGAEPGEQEQDELHVLLVLLGHLVDGLEHRLARREQGEVVADRRVRRDDLGLRDGVQGAAPVVQHQAHVGERLEPGPEAAGGLADALGDGPDLPRALGHDGHDLVGLAELVRPQDDALLFVGRHGRIVAARTPRKAQQVCAVSVAASGWRHPSRTRGVRGQMAATIARSSIP